MIPEVRLCSWWSCKLQLVDIKITLSSCLVIIGVNTTFICCIVQKFKKKTSKRDLLTCLFLLKWKYQFSNSYFGNKSLLVIIFFRCQMARSPGLLIRINKCLYFLICHFRVKKWICEIIDMRSLEMKSQSYWTQGQFCHWLQQDYIFITPVSQRWKYVCLILIMAFQDR